MKGQLILSPVADRDPRSSLDDQALLLASRNAFPVVAARPGRSDRAGLLAGGAVALLLGLATFWSMSGQRQTSAPVPPSPARLAERPPATVAEPAPPPSSAMALPTRPAPMPSVPVNQVTPMSSPVMVFDTSTVRALPAPSGAGVPMPGNAPKAAAGQGLGDNESFAARLGDAGVETASATRLADPANMITQGTLIAAILETAIDSDLPGYVRAVVSQDVRSFDGSRILIPRSSRLIGQYKSGLAAGQTRAYVLWTRLIRPDGVSVALASPATDHAGRSGLGGEVDGHFGKRFGSAILLSAVGGLGAIASGGASLIVSGGQSAASVAAQRDAQIPPTIRVRQGQPIRIFTARDLDFSTVAEEPAP
ncbi:TraB/TrbI/VirB10 family type IV secretion system protein [Rhizorhabdus sp. FW153]|uniref:TrbI/VirB10 family protein n=1 Tax=Rhizorhabdus sp. FW153 TaxID=3400216 RepID=UPI003CEECE1A